MDRRRWLTIGVVAALAVVAFLLFRPDTLVTEVEADESLEEAFATTTRGRSGDDDHRNADDDRRNDPRDHHDHCAGRAGAALVWGVRRDRAQCHGDGRHLRAGWSACPPIRGRHRHPERSRPLCLAAAARRHTRGEPRRSTSTSGSCKGRLAGRTTTCPTSSTPRSIEPSSSGVSVLPCRSPPRHSAEPAAQRLSRRPSRRPGGWRAEAWELIHAVTTAWACLTSLRDLGSR